MDLTFLIGIIGAIILTIGAAWPIEKTNVPTKSVKNWLLVVWSLIMLLYTIFWFINGGWIFYLYSEILIGIAAILMMITTKERMNLRIISTLWLLMIILSIISFPGFPALLFMIAFIILSLGYVSGMHSRNRYLWLGIWGLLIALSSYLGASRIFFWLNTLFGLFSLYYLTKLVRSQKKLA